MSRNQEPALESIVRQARTLDSTVQIAFLREACGENDALFSDALSSMNASEGSWWTGEGPESAEQCSYETLIGSLIGHYRITGVLGAGGMGRVLLAERADKQFHHKVAIKLVRGDLLSKQVQGRLRIERQILATLHHPNIAKLLDGGTHSGMPYIVMEYVEGKPIDTFCNEQRLSIRDRLVLFRQVCSAVHYAHQNLIVHRDLKPTNILVTTEGTPKLLDFGIAKMLDSRQLTHTMAVTHFDSRLLTPDHASPEQVRGDAITTASDTYVLGVLLYELLTGRKPFAVKPERLSDLERAICESSPAALTLGLRGDSKLPEEFCKRICSERNTTPARLLKDLGGDLEAIVAMALRKEPERRYSSVEQFSEDVRRFLDGLPIIARRDTLAYRTRKFVGRHTIGVATSGLGIAALGAFAVLMGLQAQRIAAERQNAEEVSAFLIGVFEQADPEHSRGREVTAKELLDSAANRIGSALDEQSVAKSRLLATLGTVYGKIGNFDDAEKALRESVALRTENSGGDHPDVADSQLRLADVLVEKNRLNEAEQLTSSALTINRKAFGDDSPAMAETLHALARIRRRQDRLDESAALHAEAVRILESQSTVNYLELISALNNWAVLLVYRKDFIGAERVYRKAVDFGPKHLGTDHPLIAQSMLGLAAALAGQGKTAEAGPLYGKAIDLTQRVFGDDHPVTANSLANYGTFLRTAGQLVEAETVLRRTVSMQEKIAGESVRTAYAKVGLAFLLVETSRAIEAKVYFEDALRTYARELPSDHLYVASALLGLGRSQLALGQTHDASDALDRAAVIVRRRYPTQSIAVASVTAAQGAVLLAQGRLRDAEPLLRESYPVLSATRGATDTYTLQVRSWIGELYSRLGREEEARAYFASLPPQ